MASAVYNNAKLEFLKGSLHWLTDTFKVMLVDTSYVYSASHVYVAEVVIAELSGAGYGDGFGGTGRKELGTKTCALSTNKAQCGAADLTWTAINAGTAAGAIVIKEATSDADSLVVAFLDFDDTVTNGGDLTVAWPSGQLFYFE